MIARAEHDALAAESALPLQVPQKPRIVPEALYTREETAALLNLQRVKGLAEIPEQLLPKTPVGANNGRVGYRGFDILAYMDGQRRINGKPAPPPRDAYRLEIVP